MTRKFPAYTELQNQFLIANYGRVSRAAIMLQFPGRNWLRIMKQASRLKCSPRAGRAPGGMRWNDETAAYLRAHYPSGGARPIAEHYETTVERVHAYAGRLGLHRDRAARAPKPAVVRAPRPAKVFVGLVNINAGKATRKRSESANLSRYPITAAEIRKLGCNDPQRLAYNNGIPGWLVWKAEQTAGLCATAR